MLHRYYLAEFLEWHYALQFSSSAFRFPILVPCFKRVGSQVLGVPGVALISILLHLGVKTADIYGDADFKNIAGMIHRVSDEAVVVKTHYPYFENSTVHDEELELKLNGVTPPRSAKSFVSPNSNY